MLEKTIQSKIINHLKKSKVFYYKNIATSVSGVPDLVYIKEGKTVFIEVKNEKGKLSKLQEYQIDFIRRCGGYAYVVRSLDEFLEIFDKE